MIKNNKLKSQLIWSSIISISLMLIGTSYLFYNINIFTTKNNEILEQTQQQLSLATSLNANLDDLISSNIKEARNPNTSIVDIKITTTSLKSDLEKLSVFRINNNYIHQVYAHVETLLKETEKLQDKNSEELLNYWTSQQKTTTTILNKFVEDIITGRNEKITHNAADFNFAKIVILVLIVLVIIFISFTFYRVIQALQTLKQTTDDLTVINDGFLDAKHEIEKTNWILETNAKLNEEISGINDSYKISQIVLQNLTINLPIIAAAIYIRKIDSYEFELVSHIGTVDNKLTNNFIYEQGFLGKIAADKRYKIFDIKDFEYIHTKSSLIDNIEAEVIMYPLVYENHCLGIIELAIESDETNQSKYLEFLSRASRNIATRIKFGQSHMLVEQLLEETQIQTEELEAQQEELRITNEELIHKTHLLESSEEELRVQQEELTQTNIELNRKAEELEVRNIDLNEAQQTVELKIQEVEQASKYKSEFMANMSHELRTPLNSILILAKLLQDNKHRNLNEEQIKYANVIHGAGSDLLELINELLDLAKIESGKIDLNLERIPTNEFLYATEDLFKAIAKEKGIIFSTSIENEVPKEFYTDEYRVQQVLKNFLSNSFKFTNQGGKVELNIKLKADNICFEVKDSGKGISQEKQDLIFEAFRQEDGSTSRKYGGTGLGLSISKEIATLLGGRITLHSEIGEGSTFTLILPIQKADQNVVANEIEKAEAYTPKTIFKVVAEAKESKPIVIDGQQRTILIIEDDINFADILKGFAENYGFKAILAHDGAKGISLAKEILPSAIILDVMLPISDGWEVLRILKEDETTKHIPIHMMSAASFSKKEFLENGAIGFMHKPVTEYTIQKTFENININLSQSVKKILLIEDQELQSDYIKNTFADQNINVIQTFSLESAWKKLNNEPNIDCIILDLHLPDGNGLELIEKIKENEKLSEIPIIINTAYELPKEQYDKILSDARATILKSDKSSDRLIDEVNLFLNKINDTSYQPVKHMTDVIQTSNLKGKRVLIADDDMRNVFALTTTLQSYDMDIEIANNGLEAVDIMKNPENKVDIILMDIMMPEMDGYEAITIIREELKYKNIPILAVTAKAMKGDREKSIQIGANDYVSKPIDIDKLTSLMQVWLG